MAPAAIATAKPGKREVSFVWEGRDKRGARIKGKSLAPDEQSLRAELRRQGVAPSRIRKQRQSLRGGKVNPGDIAVFSRQLATMLAAGIPLAIGSDAEGRTPGMNPFLNIMLISRYADHRPPLNLTREEAIAAYTRTSAYAEFEEREKGTLEAGKLADIAVLSQDIRNCPLEDLPRTQSVLTIVGGKIVYRALK